MSASYELMRSTSNNSLSQYPEKKNKRRNQENQRTQVFMFRVIVCAGMVCLSMHLSIISRLIDFTLPEYCDQYYSRQQGATITNLRSSSSITENNRDLSSASSSSVRSYQDEIDPIPNSEEFILQVRKPAILSNEEDYLSSSIWNGGIVDMSRFNKPNKTEDDDDSEDEQPAAIPVNTTTGLLNVTISSSSISLATGYYNKLQLRSIVTTDTYPDTSSCSAYSPNNAKDERDDFQSTLVMQTSVDRIGLLSEHCKRWRHDPMVVVVGATDDELRNETLIQYIIETRETCPNLELIAFKLVGMMAEDGNYPINILRNVGLDAVKTSHVITADMDFLPSLDLDLTIKSVLKEQKHLHDGNFREAVVIPAFQVKKPCTEEEHCMRVAKNETPYTFEELHQCMNDWSEEKNNTYQYCKIFDGQKGGHTSTDSYAWLDQKWYMKATAGEQYRKIKRLSCLKSLRYEPYVVLRWCPSSQDSESSRHSLPIAPYYDERFHGYGKNKISWAREVHMMGYIFSIIPEGYLIHAPHPQSPSKNIWNKKAFALKRSMDELYTGYLSHLSEKYSNRSAEAMPLCPGVEEDWRLNYLLKGDSKESPEEIEKRMKKEKRGKYKNMKPETKSTSTQ